MIHPDTELRYVGEEIGFGVFATRPIPRGTIVWVLDELDQRLPPEHVKRLGPVYAPLLNRYGYSNAAGERILCWDLGRWVNHSCRANALSSGWDFDVAVHDIAAGEEITNDYSSLNLEAGFRCHCGAPSCRGSVEPGDFERLVDQWDARVREIFPRLGQVEQPLWKLVKNPRQARAAARDPRRLPSILRHRYVGEPSAPLPRVAQTV